MRPVQPSHWTRCLVGAAVRGTHAHTALLVHRVEAAVRVLVVVTGIPDRHRVPGRHGVLAVDYDRQNASSHDTGIDPPEQLMTAHKTRKPGMESSPSKQ